VSAIWVVRFLLPASVLFAPNAHAQRSAADTHYPQRPLRMMVGFAPGGANDLLARIVGQRLSEALGQPVIIDNRTGAAGVIASEVVVRSQPDAHTLLLGSIGAQLFVPLIRGASMPYDSRRDLLPVSQVGQAGTVLVVRSDFPAKSVKELIAYAAAHPGKLTYGSAGVGNSLHIATELFRIAAGVELLHVPYKGNAPALAAVIGGQLDMLFSAVPPALPLAEAGKLRMLGVSTARRLTGIESIPTIAEAGVAGYEMSSWYGVFTRAGSPAEAVTRLALEIAGAVRSPKVREMMLAQGVEPLSGTPAQFQAFIDREFAKWSKVIRTANIPPE
jgi:tripartite-type tricarboxylate transporter receptor subunit TctC